MIFSELFNTRIFLVMILSILLSLSANSQVLNIDRENGQDSIKKKFLASSAISFSNDKQRNNYVEFSNKNELDYFLKNQYFLLLLTEADISYNGRNAIENNGYLQFRLRDNDTRKISPDLYSQYQWNGILGMESRFLLGMNARFLCAEKNKSDFYFSAGTFYEIEKWNSGLNAYNYKSDSIYVINRKMLRLNLVAKSAIKISNKIDFVETSYLQFPINSNFLKPRWTIDTSLFFEMNQHLHFFLHYDHSFDEYRALPIDAFYYSINMGLQLQL